MEYLVLLVLVVIWIILRSRDKQHRAAADAELLARFNIVEARLRELERKRSIEAAPPPPIVTAAPEPQPSARLHFASSTPAEVIEATPIKTQEVLAELPEVFAASSIPFPAPTPLEPPAPAPPAPAPPQQPAPAPRTPSLEERLGANWLNKLGIVILVFGVAFFLAYQLNHLGALGKILVGFAVSGTLLIGGLLLERRNTYRIFARAGIGGGWALTFFTTYAMYHVHATQVLSSEFLDLVLMLLVAVGMVWHSLRYKSQVVTGLAFLLAFSTVTISQVDVFSLMASAVLAAGLVYVTSREHWPELELAGLIAVYLNHFLWLTRILPGGGTPGHPFPAFIPSAAIILLYWFIFRLAYVLRAPRDHREDILTSITAVLNSAGLLGLLKYQSSHPEWTFWALLALGAAEMLLAFYVRPRRRTAFIVLSSISSGILLAAVPFRFSGANWSLLWLIEAEILFIAGIRMRESVFRRLGILAGFAAAFQLAAADILPILTLRAAQPDLSHHWTCTLALITAAILYWLNSIVLPRRWPEIISEQIDSIGLVLNSYLGLLAAAAGLWILFPGNQTTLAWMLVVLAIGFAAQRFDSDDLAIQTDLLAAASLLRILIINLPSTEHWGFLTQRAITVGLVSLLFYVATRRKRGAGLLTAELIPIAYSWAGSALLAILCWYELRPVSVAVAWAVLGLLLLELGILRKRLHLRHQALLLLAASFVRIFFVNLNASGSGEFLNPRLYTVVPLIAAYYWTCERLRGTETPSPFERVAAEIACWFGTIALASLLYFEVRAQWIVIAWAALVLLLLLVSWLANRRGFLVQSLLLTVAVFTRALLFNLESNTAQLGSFWQRPIASIGIASAILLLCLPIAFRIRTRTETFHASAGFLALLRFLVFRPEQLLFFTPLLLTTIMLAHEMRAGMITVTWSALGVSVFLIALLVRERSYRLAGLSLLLLGVGKILVIDIWRLAPTDRYITLIVTGIALLLVSFLYTRYREIILKFL